MAPSEAQKRAANKYIKEHMATLGCKVKKEEAIAFKDYANKQGKTSNTLLKEYVLQCINEPIERDRLGGSLHSQTQDESRETP